MDKNIIFSDRNLSQKLERSEGRCNAAVVATRAKLFPESGAEWIEVGGAYAMFDGVESPLTQTFGLGVFDEITAEHLEEIEAFFKKHNAPVFHEVSPLADASLIGLLNERGYQPIELTSVMFQTIALESFPELSVNPNVKTRLIEKDEVDVWAKTSAEAWGNEMEGLRDFMFEFARVSAQCDGGFPFIAEVEDKPIASGMLFIFDDVAILAGASTIVEGRKQGAQTALLDARLRFASERGCNFAMMCAAPGSGSQRNAEKNNFRIAYTRTKWQLKD